MMKKKTLRVTHYKRNTLLQQIFGVCMLTLALFAWALASPPGSSPDDDFHLPSIWCAQGDREGFCEFSVDNGGEFLYEVPEPVGLAGWYALGCLKLDSEASAKCQFQLDPANSYITNRINTEEYPGQFYLAQSLLTSSSLNISVFLMRALNILIFISSLVFVYIFSHPAVRKMLVIAVTVSLVPLGLFVLSSTNPSSWAITSSLIIFPISLQYFQQNSRSKSIIFSILLFWGFLLANWSRADAAIYAVIALVVAGVFSWGKSQVSILKFCFLGILISWSFFTYLSRIAGVEGLLGFVSSRDYLWYQDPNLWENILNLPSLWAGAFGSWNLGWFELEMPDLVWVISWGTFFSTLLLGIKFINFRKLIALSIVMFSLIFLPLYALSQAGTTVGWVVQPRYLLPLLIILVMVAIYSNQTKDKQVKIYSLAQKVAVGILLIFAYSASLHQTLRRYVSGSDVISPNLSDGLEWWWPRLELVGPNIIWATGIIAWTLYTIFLFFGELKQRKKLLFNS